MIDRMEPPATEIPEAVEPVPLTDRLAAGLERNWRLLVAGTVLFYLIATVLHGLRPFWYDELFTYYVVRLPDMSAVWGALKAGTDLNPPLFHAITRGFTAVLGNSELAFRVPAIFGFLVMMFCILRFVLRYGSPLAAVAAMALPLISGAYYYAQEARPYGMVLGFTGIAIVCWQAAARGQRRNVALPGLTLSLAAALLSHVYAVLLLVPFAVAEAVRLWREKRPDWPVLASLALACPAMLGFLPLLGSAKPGTFDNPVFRPEWYSVGAAYEMILGTAAAALVAALVVLSIPGRQVPHRDSATDDAMPLHELALAAAFALMPVYAVAVSMVVTHVFQDRYSLPAIVGCSILLGALIAARARWSRSAAAVAAVIFPCAFLIQTSIWFISLGHAAAPNSQRVPAAQLRLAGLPSDLPIVITDPLLFLEYDHYESAEVARRIYYLTGPENSLRYTGMTLYDDAFPVMKHWFPIRAQLADYREFLAQHPKFAVLAAYQSPRDWVMRKMVDDGMVLTFKGEYALRHGSAILAEAGR